MITAISMKDAIIPLQNHPSKLIRFVEQQGINLELLLENTHIAPGHIGKSRHYINYLQYAQLAKNAIALSAQPDLGLLFGKELNISSHGIIGFAAMCRATVEDALNIAIKYKKTVSPITRLRLEFDGNLATLYIDPALGEKDLEVFFIEALYASLISNLLYLSNSNQPDIKLYFKHSAPEYVQSYKDTLGQSLYFDQPSYMMQCDKSFLNTRLTLFNTSASIEAEKQCMDRLQEMNDSDSLITIIRDQLVKKMHERPNLESLADSLYTSVSTLKRKLNEQHSSYQAILDDVRKELALKYLKDSSITIDEVAHKLNFNEASNFRRAFKKWTGKTPSDYRNNQE